MRLISFVFKDVVNGHEKLNLAFVANLFNNHPSLDEPDQDQVVDVDEETREEKMFRNWINSLGVAPQVNYLYSDLSNGLIILQLEDTITPGVVDWDRRVVTKEKLSKIRAKRFQETLANCNYAAEVARKLEFEEGVEKRKRKTTPSMFENLFPFRWIRLEIQCGQRA